MALEDQDDISYLILLKALDTKGFLYQLKQENGTWHFRFGHYHSGLENNSDPEHPELEHAYGRMQVDLDIFAETESKCAKLGYLALKDFSNKLAVWLI